MNMGRALMSSDIAATNIVSVVVTQLQGVE